MSQTEKKLYRWLDISLVHSEFVYFSLAIFSCSNMRGPVLILNTTPIAVGQVKGLGFYSAKLLFFFFFWKMLTHIIVNWAYGAIFVSLINAKVFIWIVVFTEYYSAWFEYGSKPFHDILFCFPINHISSFKKINCEKGLLIS